MNRSTSRILTTHCGSLPRPRELLAPLHAKDAGEHYDRDELAVRVRQSVTDVVRRQIELGIDVVDDGEHGKSSFATYARMRIGGLERTDQARPRLGSVSRDALASPAVYEEMRVMFGARGRRAAARAGMTALIAPGRSNISGTGVRPTSRT
jgi:5-methyltetrahydropteroyltriglutamate--homocysteine methyltransferase